MSVRETSYRQHLIIGVTTFCEIIGPVSFALRLWARKTSKADLWWDDYVMGLGLFFAAIPGICNFVGLHYGLGKHVVQVPEIDVQNFLINFYVLQLGYVSTFPTIKISVLFFYYRIFPQKQFRWCIKGVGAFMILFLLSNWLTVSLQCQPIHSFWQPHIPHHCIDQVKYYIAQGSLNFVSDIAVVLMPIPVLWRLHLPRQERLGLIVVFMLGGLACAISLCRVISLNEVDPEDITWSNVGPGLWSASEAEVLVISGNLPLMNPLFRRLTNRLGWHIRPSKISKDEEESSNILELSDLSKKGRNKAVKASYMASCDSNTPHGKGGPGSKIDFNDGLPENRILVESDLEMNVQRLGSGRPLSG